MQLANRAEAAEKIAAQLTPYQDDPKAIVLGIPLGGVVLGALVAKKLHLGLDIVATAKLTAPGNADLAIGAVAEGDVQQFNHEVIGMYDISMTYVDQENARAKLRLKEVAQSIRGAARPTPLADLTVIVVDEGLVTGYSMAAALQSIINQGPSKTIIAVPFATHEALEVLNFTGPLIVLDTPEATHALSSYYKEYVPADVAMAQAAFSGLHR